MSDQGLKSLSMLNNTNKHGLFTHYLNTYRWTTIVVPNTAWSMSVMYAYKGIICNLCVICRYIYNCSVFLVPNFQIEYRQILSATTQNLKVHHVIVSVICRDATLFFFLYLFLQNQRVCASLGYEHEIRNACAKNQNNCVL